MMAIMRRGDVNDENCSSSSSYRNHGGINNRYATSKIAMEIDKTVGV